MVDVLMLYVLPRKKVYRELKYDEEDVPLLNERQVRPEDRHPDVPVRDSEE